MASSSQTYTMEDSDVFGFKTVPVKNDDGMYVCDFADCNKKFKTMIGEQLLINFYYLVSLTFDRFEPAQTAQPH